MSGDPFVQKLFMSVILFIYLLCLSRNACAKSPKYPNKDSIYNDALSEPKYSYNVDNLGNDVYPHVEIKQLADLPPSKGENTVVIGTYNGAQPISRIKSLSGDTISTTLAVNASLTTEYSQTESNTSSSGSSSTSTTISTFSNSTSETSSSTPDMNSTSEINSSPSESPSTTESTSNSPESTSLFTESEYVSENSTSLPTETSTATTSSTSVTKTTTHKTTSISSTPIATTTITSGSSSTTDENTPTTAPATTPSQSVKHIHLSNGTYTYLLMETCISFEIHHKNLTINPTFMDTNQNRTRFNESFIELVLNWYEDVKWIGTVTFELDKLNSTVSNANRVDSQAYFVLNQMSVEINGSPFSSNGKLNVFKTEVGAYYTCQKLQSFNLKPNSTEQYEVLVYLSNLKLEAFHNSNTTDFVGTEHACVDQPSGSNTVGIVIGVVVCVLVLAAVIAFLIIRRRQSNAYHQRFS